MKKLMILLALSAVATSVLADATVSRTEAALEPTVASVQTSKRMNDADLDNVTAGYRIITNPGKAAMTIENKRGVVISINPDRIPPPPPPPPG